MFLKCKAIMVAVLLMMQMVLCTAVHAELKNSTFLTASEQERQWWLMGAFTIAGHMVAQKDNQKSHCIWQWYFQEKTDKQKVVEAAMRKYPDYEPSALIMVLLHKHCGGIL